VQTSRLRGVLFPELRSNEDGEEPREEKIKRIKKMIKDDSYITHEKLNKTFEKMLAEVDRD